ncbi:MAG: hypothetical protein AB8G11_08110 [Saprospiraceae bacterium]
MYIYEKDKDNRTVLIDDEDYLDLKIQVEENKTTVNILNETILLENAVDLPILIDVIQELMNLEFYDNCQLSDKTEVITYKSKNFSTIDFLTNIKIKARTNKTIFIDVFDLQNKFSVVVIGEKLVFQYFYQIEGGALINKSIEGNHIDKIILKPKTIKTFVQYLNHRQI